MAVQEAAAALAMKNNQPPLRSRRSAAAADLLPRPLRQLLAPALQPALAAL